MASGSQICFQPLYGAPSAPQRHIGSFSWAHPQLNKRQVRKLTDQLRGKTIAAHRSIEQIGGRIATF
jgi:hypothetical protein